jgi:hypothetical protein
MMGLLEGWAEAMSGEFDSEDVYKHVVGVCDDGNKVEGVDDKAGGASDRDDIMGVQVEVCFTHIVGVRENGEEDGGAYDA